MSLRRRSSTRLVAAAAAGCASVSFNSSPVASHPQASSPRCHHPPSMRFVVTAAGCPSGTSVAPPAVAGMVHGRHALTLPPAAARRRHRRPRRGRRRRARCGRRRRRRARCRRRHRQPRRGRRRRRKREAEEWERRKRGRRRRRQRREDPVDVLGEEVMGRVMELLDARSTWRWVAADDRLWAPKAYLMRAGAVIHSHGMETCIATMLNTGAKEFRL
ncbi:hypothetical protein DAI22_07g092000 [Oryza sativa Japonica Group]|nr:hypothetical protein DAI22_07g092000 [Oryza sativa Japonica Group]KAF2922168.1 hypothetical protein DAI22_07g092000 [Oryza sativa Japonica Group]KAF2922169.1 hypothetical protein DAI22_07g092000 [Oryza sativa Japonica Group]